MGGVGYEREKLERTLEPTAREWLQQEEYKEKQRPTSRPKAKIKKPTSRSRAW